MGSNRELNEPITIFTYYVENFMYFHIYFASHCLIWGKKVTRPRRWGVFFSRNCQKRPYYLTLYYYRLYGALMALLILPTSNCQTCITLYMAEKLFKFPFQRCINQSERVTRSGVIGDASGLIFFSERRKTLKDGWKFTKQTQFSAAHNLFCPNEASWGNWYVHQQSEQVQWCKNGDGYI